ncbi:MAG: YutD family protein [Lactobacillus sp.]|jgi:uncharacterized protein YutD|nr:YutD family protein [Lactobacillus sp.]
MTEAVKKKQTADQQTPKLYHPLAKVVQAEDELEINWRAYEIIINYKDALDLDLLREKYDPFLNQYDYLIGDVASDHLRLKGFFAAQRRARMDQRAQTMADYVTEYVNPGSPYFVLKALSPAERPKVKHGKRRRSKKTNRRQSVNNRHQSRPRRGKNHRQGRKKA